MTTPKSTYSLYDDNAHKTATSHESQAVRLHPRYAEANENVSEPIDIQIPPSTTDDVVADEPAPAPVSSLVAAVEEPDEAITHKLPLTASESPRSPGAYLRQNREQQNLSLDYVADKLCLHNGLLRNLEADHYENMHAQVFIRGYIRAYANLLDLPAEEVLALYQPQIGTSAPPQLSAQTTRHKTQTNSGDPWFKVGTFVLFLVLMVLMTLWKFYPNNTDNSPSEQPSFLPPSPELPINNNNPAGQNSSTPLPAQPVPMSSQPLSALPAGATTATPTESSNNGAESEMVYTPPDEGDNTEIETTVIGVETPAETTADAETPASNATTDKFSLVITADAWMQINDSDGKQLFLGTAQQSQTLALEGTPPFQVRVGNVDGVDVKNNGSTQPLAAFPREGRRVYVIGQKSE